MIERKMKIYSTIIAATVLLVICDGAYTMFNPPHRGPMPSMRPSVDKSRKFVSTPTSISPPGQVRYSGLRIQSGPPMSAVPGTSGKGTKGLMNHGNGKGQPFKVKMVQLTYADFEGRIGNILTANGLILFYPAHIMPKFDTPGTVTIHGLVPHVQALGNWKLNLHGKKTEGKFDARVDDWEPIQGTVLLARKGTEGHMVMSKCNFDLPFKIYNTVQVGDETDIERINSRLEIWIRKNFERILCDVLKHTWNKDPNAIASPSGFIDMTDVLKELQYVTHDAEPKEK